MDYMNGNKYMGEWKNNMKNGQGVMTYANGEKYEGEWKDDKREGDGKSVVNFHRSIYL